MTVSLPALGTASIPLAVSGGGGHPSREVDFISVHERLAPILEDAVLLGSIPVLGSPSWLEIPVDDSRWRHSVVAAGYRWAMREWLAQDAEVQFSQEFSSSRDWGATARYIRNRREWLAANPWYRRRTA